MKLRLRQIALAVADLEAATSQASQVLGLGPAYQDPAIVRYGLRNAVYAIDNTFLEFVSPITEADEEMRESLKSADFKEGVAHFLEKRPAKFIGS